MAILGFAGAMALGATPAASEASPDRPAFLPSRPADVGEGGHLNLKAVRQKIVRAFDADGNKKLDADERAALRERARQWALSRFDDDGNGRLDSAEREALQRAFRATPSSPAPTATPLPAGAVEA